MAERREKKRPWGDDEQDAMFDWDMSRMKVDPVLELLNQAVHPDYGLGRDEPETERPNRK
ncbi:hypothetical protein [Effusibacillus pohliae]|uniref:hypothetical protein n=1 Tax=Effusibacillus pohliae TaxID=232270 RepID=UPI00037CE71C|nr:hypothetical protein [Effusibacillus pohliae]